MITPRCWLRRPVFLRFEAGGVPRGLCGWSPGVLRRGVDDIRAISMDLSPKTEMTSLKIDEECMKRA